MATDIPEPARPGADQRDADRREIVIDVHGLTKRYHDVVAVQEATFEVLRGEIFGLLGPNGAGKTTTVECLQGLRHCDGGRLRVLGLDPQHQTAQLRPHIGSQLQQSSLPEHMRVWEALDLFSSFVPGHSDWRLLLERWGLADKAKASFHSLSGGQRQRLFVALALVNHPEVVFLDEMTTGLDPAARHVAWDLVREIRERGTTVVLVTHFMEEAERLCDRIAIMDGGRIVASDTPRGLVEAYAGGVRVTFTTDEPDVSWLYDVPCVDELVHEGTCVLVRGTGPVLALVAAELVDHGIAPADLRLDQPSLEDVFLALTGHEMRE
jgi:ABC-2 type transport system ATP-binding protein